MENNVKVIITEGMEEKDWTPERCSRKVQQTGTRCLLLREHKGLCDFTSSITPMSAVWSLLEVSRQNEAYSDSQIVDLKSKLMDAHHRLVIANEIILAGRNNCNA